MFSLCDSGLRIQMRLFAHLMLLLTCQFMRVGLINPGPKPKQVCDWLFRWEALLETVSMIIDHSQPPDLHHWHTVEPPAPCSNSGPPTDLKRTRSPEPPGAVALVTSAASRASSQPADANVSMKSEEELRTEGQWRSLEKQAWSFIVTVFRFDAIEVVLGWLLFCVYFWSDRRRTESMERSEQKVLCEFWMAFIMRFHVHVFFLISHIKMSFVETHHRGHQSVDAAI